MVRPLDGIRVLDFTRVLAGPHAGRMLCDLGADVIKVEPPAGDTTRFTNPRIHGLSSYYVQQNVGKRNISLDLAAPEAVRLVLGLVEHSDVVLENFRPGVMERLGLGYAAMSARNPRIVYASISGYGQTGPWVHRRAYAAAVCAETGFTRFQGDATGGDYRNDPHSVADVYTGIECAAAVLAALYARERTGRGDHIDVSMAETMLYTNEHAHDHLWDGPDDPNWVHSFAPGDYPVVAAANGEHVVISGHPADRGTFERYAQAIGRPEMCDEARFADVASRKRHLAAIHEAIAAWAATMPDAESIEATLSAVELAAGRLRSVRDLAGTEWAAARGAVVEVPDRGGGTIRVPNAPWHFEHADAGVRGEPRYRGEDNRAVLGELLDVDDETLDDLVARGVLSSRLP